MVEKKYFIKKLIYIQKFIICRNIMKRIYSNSEAIKKITAAVVRYMTRLRVNRQRMQLQGIVSRVVALEVRTRLKLNLFQFLQRLKLIQNQVPKVFRKIRLIKANISLQWDHFLLRVTQVNCHNLSDVEIYFSEVFLDIQ